MTDETNWRQMFDALVECAGFQAMAFDEWMHLPERDRRDDLRWASAPVPALMTDMLYWRLPRLGELWCGERVTVTHLVAAWHLWMGR